MTKIKMSLSEIQVHARDRVRGRVAGAGLQGRHLHDLVQEQQGPGRRVRHRRRECRHSHHRLHFGVESSTYLIFSQICHSLITSPIPVTLVKFRSFPDP